MTQAENKLESMSVRAKNDKNDIFFLTLLRVLAEESLRNEVFSIKFGLGYSLPSVGSALHD